MKEATGPAFDDTFAKPPTPPKARFTEMLPFLMVTGPHHCVACWVSKLERRREGIGALVALRKIENRRPAGLRAPRHKPKMHHFHLGVERGPF